MTKTSIAPRDGAEAFSQGWSTKANPFEASDYQFHFWLSEWWRANGEAFKSHVTSGSERPADTAVENYWYELYTSPGGMCSLCAQKGVLDSRGARTPAGTPVGRLNFCICPNGRQMRFMATQGTGK